MRWVPALFLVFFWPQQSWSTDLPARAPSTNAGEQNSSYICGGYYGADCARPNGDHYHLAKLEVWGFLDMPVYATGTRMAPNGVAFDPLFALNASFNIGLLPGKKLYLFSDSSFWMQRPGFGITNPSQGNLDFSKREFDFVAGVAWNYFGSFELRASAYGLNNLNRGLSLASPRASRTAFSSKIDIISGRRTNMMSVASAS